ncbi:MAG: cisplatin damage response ATP-dependent DNA ligase [Hyphomicrobium sp.]
MRAFADLLDGLVYTQSRNRKIALLAAYFRATADPDRGYALAALTDGVPVRLPLRRILTDLTGRFVDPVLYKLSRDYVGDTAETVALLWPDTPSNHAAAPTLAQVVDDLRAGTSAGRMEILKGFLDTLDPSGRWALLKLLGGAPRVGVSARLARTALAQAFGREVDEIEEIWHALDAPYVDLFAWLEGRADKPDTHAKPVFRPVMLAHPIEDADWPRLVADDHVAEWKWDGIRIQISARGGAVRMFSRQGDDVSAAFPEIQAAYAGRACVVDGELLVMREGVIAPFNDLQQRLNRKAVSARLASAFPAHVRLYDLLVDGDDDLRALPLTARRQRLERWFDAHRPAHTDLSQPIPFATFDDLNALWSNARADGIEGLMLKRKDSAYQAGRVKGQWWKWKRAALTLDCVLMYAQRGSGKRSSFYSDYTFGVWRDGANGAGELVPVGKAYSGFTDAELRQLDTWIRANTTETFGPVRAVSPGLVLEVAFDAVQLSTRHKSGVAMRFPRIHRIRWDKPAAEADRLDTVRALIAQASATATADGGPDAHVRAD